MPRPNKGQIQTRLRTAIVDDVAKHGIGALSMLSVAKRARVSAGTIYLHFANKEDMLQQVYLQIKQDVHARIMQAENAPNCTLMVRDMWYHLFDFVRDHPNDFLFVEYAGAAQVLSPDQAQIITHHQRDIQQLIQRAIDDKVLADIPVRLLGVLLIAPAMHLARQALLHGLPPSQQDIDQTFAQVWQSVSRRAGTPPLS